MTFLKGGVQVQEAPSNKYDAKGDGFEPRDEIKGDVARMLFYMAVRYEGEGSDGTADLELLDIEETKPGMPNIGRLCTLYSWHFNDEVDKSEKNRNEKIYTKWQGNRNPFIDHPEWVQLIWGGYCEHNV
tara:strand:+ start:412 stop:798 length:387 start_codon:yes stop_codon:yes gene_type:complete